MPFGQKFESQTSSPTKANTLPQIGNSPILPHAIPSHLTQHTGKPKGFHHQRHGFCLKHQIIFSALPIKSVGSCFIWNDPPRYLSPALFSPWTKFLSCHLLNMLLKPPIYIHRRGGIETCRTSLWGSWKGFGMSRMNQLPNSFGYYLLHADGSVHDHPCSFGLPNGAHLHPSNRPRL